jgi:hypothetical protein
MDEVYNKWRKNECKGMSRLEVISKFFTLRHKAAVQLGNMNYQVENGGWSQWDMNGYSEDIDDLIEYCKKGIAMKIKHFDKLLEILKDVKMILENMKIHEENRESLDDDEYYDGEEEYESLSRLDDKYYEIDQTELIESFDEFLKRFDEKTDVSGIKVESTIKPKVKLIGENGNVFNIIGKVSKALKQAGQKNKAGEFEEKALNAKSYMEVLCLVAEYVDIL